MSREIKFRGKRVDNGKEIKGGFYELDVLYDRDEQDDSLVERATFRRAFFIQPPNAPSQEVHPDTVGQYTGQTDKHGVEEIYTGSQVEVTWDDGKKELYAIEWSDEWWGFCLDSGAKMPPASQIEVIGNIHTEQQ